MWLLRPLSRVPRRPRCWRTCCGSHVGCCPSWLSSASSSGCLRWLPLYRGPPTGAGAGVHGQCQGAQVDKKNLNLGFAKLKALVPFLLQSRKHSKADILKDVFKRAKDWEETLDRQNYNNTSEPYISLARNLSRNIPNMLAVLWAWTKKRKGPGQMAAVVSQHTFSHQSMMSRTGAISPTGSLERFLEVEVLSHRLPQVYKVKRPDQGYLTETHPVLKV